MLCNSGSHRECAMVWNSRSYRGCGNGVEFSFPISSRCTASPSWRLMVANSVKLKAPSVIFGGLPRVSDRCKFMYVHVTVLLFSYQFSFCVFLDIFSSRSLQTWSNIYVLTFFIGSAFFSSAATSIPIQILTNLSRNTPPAPNC